MTPLRKRVAFYLSLFLFLAADRAMGRYLLGGAQFFVEILVLFCASLSVFYWLNRPGVLGNSGAEVAKRKRALSVLLRAQQRRQRLNDRRAKGQ